MSSTEYFERVASRWDDMRASFFGDEVRSAAFEKAEPGPGELAVDVGAGTGFVSEALLARGLQVIAVDQSAAMLEQLTARLRDQGDLHCVVADGHALPLDTGSVDCVFANMYLHHVEAPAAAVAEMARILRPGGRLAITDLDRHEHEWLLVEHQDRWPGFERSEVLGWLSEAGLADASVSDTHSTCRASSEVAATRAEVSVFVAYGRKPASSR